MSSTYNSGLERVGAPEPLGVKPDAFVRHRTYGIGRYLGLQTKTVDGVDDKYAVVEYRDGDMLYIPLSLVGDALVPELNSAALDAIEKHSEGVDSALDSIPDQREEGDSSSSTSDMAQSQLDDRHGQAGAPLDRTSPLRLAWSGLRKHPAWVVVAVLLVGGVGYWVHAQPPTSAGLVGTSGDECADRVATAMVSHGSVTGAWSCLDANAVSFWSGLTEPTDAGLAAWVDQHGIASDTVSYTGTTHHVTFGEAVAEQEAPANPDAPFAALNARVWFLFTAKLHSGDQVVLWILARNGLVDVTDVGYCATGLTGSVDCASAIKGASKVPPLPVSITTSRYGVLDAVAPPGSDCQAEATFPSGNVSRAAGLSLTHVSGPDGRVGWRYNESVQTNPGTGTHVVTCTLGARSGAASATFSVP
jgi:CarD-like/TRCF domain